jgi:hypothetical protein
MFYRDVIATGCVNITNVVALLIPRKEEITLLKQLQSRNGFDTNIS